MKTGKILVVAVFVFATLVAVTNSFGAYLGRAGGHGVYDCETDSFSK